MKKRRLFDLKLDVEKAQETFDVQMKIEDGTNADQNILDTRSLNTKN